MRPAITVDPAAATPIYRQVYDAWRAGILAGRFPGGSRVPSTRELAAVLAVARSTVTQAYEQLIAEGYLQTARGSGTFVCRELPDQLLRTRPVTPTQAGKGAAIRLSCFGAGLRDDFPRRPRLSGYIDFAYWGADLAQFPFALWRKLLLRRMRRFDATLFDYADSARGYEPLRLEIAAYVARSRAVRCTPEQVIIVNGSQQALEFCTRLLLEPGDSVAFENPGYLGTRRILNAYGARLAPTRIDAEGVVVATIDANARMAYVTPSHQFPTGVALSLARRLALIEWARVSRAVIIEDDYDSEYRYSGPPLPAMQGLAADAPVIYCGTFSKVMFPALRIGYVIVPPTLVDAFARTKWLTDRHTPLLEQAVLADFLSEGHLDRHIRRMRRHYGRRREALVEALDRYFGSDARVSGDPAGMHMLVRFDDPSVRERAGANRVQLADIGDYYLTKPPCGEFVFGFSALGEGTIREGVERLAR
jgi:GntR family transcriptional regulator / MocR family aminotransferase